MKVTVTNNRASTAAGMLDICPIIIELIKVIPKVEKSQAFLSGWLKT